MKQSSFKQYQTFLIDHIHELSGKQYIQFLELAIQRIPFPVVYSFTLDNEKGDVLVGFKKLRDECPFCETK